MIQVNELRIGNWIDFVSQPGKYEQVMDIRTHNVETPIINRVDINDIIGIPLTEEWLTNFGFKKIFENKLDK